MIERIDTQTDSSFEIQATREQVATVLRLALDEHIERNNRFHPEYRLSVQMDYLAERTLAKLRGQTAEGLERIIVQEPQITLGRLSDDGRYENYVDIVIRESLPVCRVTISKLSNFPEIADSSFRSLINFVGRQLDTLDAQLQPNGPVIDRQEKEDLSTSEGDELLTDRQKEIAHLLAGGMNYKAIAEKLVIAESTVKRHGDDIQKRWGITGGMPSLQIEAKRRGYGKV